MVLRFWSERSLSELLALEATDAEAILEAVEDRVASALESFAKARKLDREGEHGYVTPVQMIARVAEGVMEAARRVSPGRKMDLATLTSRSDRTGKWLRDNLNEAHALIDEVKHLRGPRSASTKVRESDGRLAGLYPHRRDELIKIWSDMLQAQPSEDQALRRGLIRLYRMKYNDSWASMPPAIVRHVAFLLEESRDVRDLRTWLRAYRLLPEFSYVKAISQVERLAHLYPNEVDPHFYLYSLLFLVMKTQDKDVEERVLDEIDRCRRLTSNSRYRDYGYEWMASQAAPCPLAHFTELGQWDTAKNDYPPQGAAKLKVLSGVIEEILGPEKGWIRLGPKKLRAFFPPRKDFSQAEHAGREVEFYLGFTYEGFRAYGVRLPRNKGAGS
jgi:hypothetical protein